MDNVRQLRIQQENLGRVKPRHKFEQIGKPNSVNTHTHIYIYSKYKNQDITYCSKSKYEVNDNI
jgi:hypothetical protein